jgi:hypothetical protein
MAIAGVRHTGAHRAAACLLHTADGKRTRLTHDKTLENHVMWSR